MKMWHEVTAMTFVVCILVTLGVFLTPWPGVTKENFDRIPLQSAKGYVQEIMSDPVTARASRIKIHILPPMPELPPGCTKEKWRGHEGIAIFHFDQKNHVIAKGWYPSYETFRQKMNRWFGIY